MGTVTFSMHIHMVLNGGPSASVSHLGKGGVLAGQRRPLRPAAAKKESNVCVCIHFGSIAVAGTPERPFREGAGCSSEDSARRPAKG